MGILLCMPLYFFAQVQGNAAYSEGNVNYNQKYRLQDHIAQVNYQNTDRVTLTVSGIYNIEADGYIAIFACTQTGKTADEADKLMNDQIQKVTDGIRTKGIKAESYVDMISFVPMYEYETEKKAFSKRTYKEVPIGFEMKKNLHIRFTDPNALDKIISLCSKAEIYDLVKVDYFAEDIQGFKTKMRDKALEILNQKITFHKEVMNVDLDSKKRSMGEGFNLMYPIEQYASYSAYSSSSLQAKKPGHVQTAQKSVTRYYNQIFPKSHDFVMNAKKLAPGMQLLYTLSVTYDLREKDENAPQPVAQKQEPQKPEKELILVTSTGQFKVIPVD